MGGILILISILVPTLLWSDLSNPLVWIVILSTLAFAGIGFADDYIKTVHKHNQGLTGRQKLALQFLTSASSPSHSSTSIAAALTPRASSYLSSKTSAPTSPGSGWATSRTSTGSPSSPSSSSS